VRARRATLWAAALDPGDRALLDPGVPADLDRRPDVLVVGGGVIALATPAGWAGCCWSRRRRQRPAGPRPGPELHQLSDPLAVVAPLVHARVVSFTCAAGP
jgi:hypothetical protein